MIGNVPVGCGQCMPCRIDRRRVWTVRQMLESYCHSHSSFVTLTYDEDHVPDELKPRDVQLWLKRLRKELAPHKIRFYLVGEYGDETWRPHYHASIFGLPATAKTVVHSTWAKGFVSAYPLTAETCQYTAKYVLKKMTAPSDGRLSGRHPEFCRMSNRPGIGADAMLQVAEALASPDGLAELDESGDVPYQLRLGKRTLPLGRYLRNVLRDQVGLPEDWREAAKNEWSMEKSVLSDELLLEALKTDPLATYKSVQPQPSASLEARAKIQSSRRKL